MSNSRIILEIFDKLRKANCSLNLIGDDLKLEIPKDYRIPDEEIQKIRKYKTEIIQMLRSMEEVANQEELPPIIPFDRTSMEAIPLSYSQKRFWFVDQLEGSTHYHIPLIYELTGDFDPEAFDYAWKYIMNRYEVYRTIFKEKEGEVHQFIMNPDAWEITHIEAQNWTEEETVSWVNKEVSSPFDLSKDYLLRIHVLKLSETRTGLVIIFHHITMDGWSLPLVQKEVMDLYTAYIKGEKAELAPVALQYADFANWQKNYLKGELFNKKLTWWKNYLSDAEPLELPLDYPRPNTQSIRGASYSFLIEPEIQKQIHRLSNEENATLFMILLACLKILLYRYSGQEDICVGTPAANRVHAELEKVVGCFINSLVLRSNLSGDPSFQEILERLRTQALIAYQHQDVPIDIIIEQVVKERDLSYRPLFQVLFIMQNLPVGEVSEGSGIGGIVEAESHAIGPDVAKFDISFIAAESPDGIHVSIEYCDDLFKAKTIEAMANHYKRILKSLLERPALSISKLSLLTPEEQQQLQVDFNNTHHVYPPDKTIRDYFETQAANSPEAVAIYFEDSTITYRELDEKSNQLAHYLIEKGVCRESLLALTFENSPLLIVNILAVFKVGASYLPVSADFPLERKTYLLQDSKASHIVGTKETIRDVDDNLSSLKVEIVYLDQVEIELKNYPQTAPGLPLSNEQLAYTIYTSGSTGKPKGVLISHASLVDYSLGFRDYFKITAKDKVIQQSSISFDTLIEEVFPCLISGASLIILPEGGKDIKSLKASIEQKGATILSSTPVVLEWLGKSLTNTGQLRYIISGGDLLKPSQIAPFFGKVAIVNSYGPSESTVCATYHEIQSLDEAAIIGKPIVNREIYILSADLQMVPIGLRGEICIGGRGLAQGYLGKKALTQEKFINHPYKSGERLYRTGDYGKWLPDGRIAFLGRIDKQVKLRGYRIELGEIEHAIRAHSLVSDCVVRLQAEKEADKYLVAYVVVHDTYSKEQIEKDLARQLPSYMLPSFWVELESIPMNNHGKVDLHALPKPDFNTLRQQDYLAPESALEQELITIWEELLETSSIGVNHNFFELGGHSLLAMELVFMIEKKFSVKISVRSIFESGTIRELTKYIKQENIPSKTYE